MLRIRGRDGKKDRVSSPLTTVVPVSTGISSLNGASAFSFSLSKIGVMICLGKLPGGESSSKITGIVSWMSFSIYDVQIYLIHISVYILLYMFTSGLNVTSLLQISSTSSKTSSTGGIKEQTAEVLEIDCMNLIHFLEQWCIFV